MTEENTGADSATAMFETWMKNVTALWQPMISAWSEATAAMLDSAPGDGGGERTGAAWDANRRIWKAMASTMSDPASAEAAIKGISSLPETALHLLQSTGSGLADLQRKWAERIQKMGAADTPFSFDDLDREFINRWTDLYKEELQQYLHVPQIGLTRFYQERLATALDRYQLYQAANTEFMQLLTVPVEKSFRAMQQQLADMADEGPLPEDSKSYYNLWIKTLEGHFMTLFKSPEYSEALAKTTTAMSNYVAAQRRVLEDLLQALPVPTERDIDDLYKEVYQIKKMVKKLEKSANGE